MQPACMRPYGRLLNAMTYYPAQFPATRLRRFRQAGWSRSLVRETVLTPADFVLPLFVKEGEGDSEPIPTLPGVFCHTISRLLDVVSEAQSVGIPAIALFPVTDPALKTSDGREAINPDNLVCRAIHAVKKTIPEVGVIADVALDPYTDHGHDGVLVDGTIANDASVAVLVDQAMVLAEAGCDVVAPSDMMDGRVGAIRNALEAASLPDVLILSYAVKYASALYGPFRDAVGSSGALSGASKSTYQMDPCNGREALREVALDIQEGADAVMVKPGLSYLDVISRVRQEFAVPVFAYHVSGEYAMVKAGGGAGLFNSEDVMKEHLITMKRAGADAILSYAALDIARTLTGEL